MSKNYRFSRDVDEAVAMADALESYIRSNTLYGVTSSGLFSGMPSMTVGALLLRLRRLDTLRDRLTDRHIKRLDKAIEQYELARTEWALHYETKIPQEAHSRIDAMKTFFYECANSIRLCRGIYRPEITRRTIVQELLKEMQVLDLKDTDLVEKVEAVDEKLSRVTESEEFQWSSKIQPAYPEREFWWLYAAPPDLP